MQKPCCFWILGGGKKGLGQVEDNNAGLEIPLFKKLKQMR